jgi:hypothetical protein
VKRILLVAFFLETGFVLLVVPWSAYWDRNYFAQALPAVQPIITNNFVRGAVSGLGLLNIAAGLIEIVSMVARRHRERPASITSDALAEE